MNVKEMLKNWVLVATLGLSVGVAGTARAADAKDIVDTAVSAGDFGTLVTAVKAAGLVETLKGDGPFTVFAPTDAAFAKLPKAQLDALLAKPEQLKAVLLYHVVPGKVMAADVTKLTTARTALGQSVRIDATKGVKIDGATVTATDIACKNGVIHVIDTVILPKNDVIEVARGAGSFKTLLAAIEAAGLTDALRADGPFTVFAPTDAAFAKLPAGTVEALLKDVPKLKSILLYHVVSGKKMAADVVKATELKTLQGQSLTVDTKSGPKVDEALIVKTDVAATNGVIHVIDTVVLPD